jgi:nitrate reductase NapE component
MHKNKKSSALLFVFLVLSFCFFTMLAGAEVGKPAPEISGQS